MASDNTVLSEYNRRAAEWRAVADQQEKQFQLIGNLRLLAGLSAAGLGFAVFGSAGVPLFWLIVPVSAFVALVVMHSKVVQRRENARRALRFHEQGLARLENRWMGAGEAGIRFQSEAHVYAADLDLFGKGSLFELLCAARTRAGEDALAAWLMAPGTVAAAGARQAAIAELAPRLDLREDLALIGEQVREATHPEALSRWAEAAAVQFPAALPVVAALLSSATLISLIGVMTGLWGRVPLLVSVMVQMSVGFYFRPRVHQVVEGVELPSHDLEVLSELIERVENVATETELLRQLKARLTTEGRPTSARIAELRRLATWLEWKHNQFFTPFAAALMWSTQLAVAIEKWRQHSGRGIREWIAVAGEFEALCALSAYRFEHPALPFPLLVEGPAPRFEGEALTHPLLPVGQAVANDVHLDAGSPLMVVSGSNMSGKSTLLRTIGLNTVLAWAGAPVCARRLTISPLQAAASIRVQDSLQDGKSRFYAEITRLRQIVDLTGSPLPVLFLVDELLSGTNSHDRRIGAAAIVRSLIQRGAIGLLTTHDLALAHIAEEIQPAGVNVHFADTMEHGKLHFDYHLMPGVVERSNALELMRSVGLDV